MKKGRLIRIYWLVHILAALAVFFPSCKKKITEGMIIFTQDSETETEAKIVADPFFENIEGSQIITINTNQPQKAPIILSNDFYSACSPEVSYDGRFMLFAAQKEPTDNWQIWEMNLDNLKTRQVTFFTENCISPAYLPGGNFVFSKFSANDIVKGGYSLHTGNLDGTDIRQITFNPHTYSGISVLNDGRVLTISRQVYPDAGDGKLMVLRPDGTKQELFYQALNGSELSSQGRETEGGKIVFIESDDKSKESGNIISISYNQPLHSRDNLTSDIKGNFYSVSPFQPGRFLVTFRPEGEQNTSLYEFTPESKTFSLVYKKEGYRILDAVFVAKHERPRKLPSEVNAGVKTGLLLCQDINFLGVETEDSNHSFSKTDKIEVIGIDSTLGVVSVEEDGSFYLKILADTPFRLRTLSEDNLVVKGPGNWIYLRPNERRGCVGCHAGNEQSPFNRQPLSVKKDPVLIPAHILGISEHKVSLE